MYILVPQGSIQPGSTLRRISSRFCHTRSSQPPAERYSTDEQWLLCGQK